MLFVIETNTLVSAILKPISIPAQALAKAQAIGRLLFSVETADELRSVIQRTKFDRYLSTKSRQEKTEEILATAKLIVVEINSSIEYRDSSDIKFLALAWQTPAACLISGDADLLILQPFRGIPILTASDFLKSFRFIPNCFFLASSHALASANCS